MSIKLFDDTSIAMSRKLALNYSTSFSLGIRLLSKDSRWAVSNQKVREQQGQG